MPWPTRSPSRCPTDPSARCRPGPLRATWPRPSGPGWPRRRSSPASTAPSATSTGCWPTATTWPSSSRRATGACSRCATRRPTCWPRPCSTSSPAPPSPSARPSPTASTTTSPLPGGETFTPDDLERLDARMRAIIAERQPFVRDEIPEAEALELFRDHPFKIEIIQGQADDPMSATETGLVRTYANPPRFIDLCRGPHVPHTGRLGPLQADAGGRRLLARRREATRCCSASTARPGPRRRTWPPTSTRLVEAEKRDHRKLGAELDLFSFPDEIGSGLAVFHPKGGLVRRLMEDYSRVSATSGPATSSSTRPTSPSRTCSRRPGTSTGSPRACSRPWSSTGAPSYYLKPMNCPFHILIYKSQQRSYRDLPLRLFEFGTVYRYEKSGRRPRPDPGAGHDPGRRPHLLHQGPDGRRAGRPRSHFVLDLLRDYGLDDFYLELSTRPEGKAVGTDAEWEEATETLRSVAEAKDLELVHGRGRRRLLRPQDLGADPRRHRPHVADVDHPARLPDAPALRHGVHRRRRRAPTRRS